MTRTEMVLK